MEISLVSRDDRRRPRPSPQMAKAGDQYTFRTGNIWNFCQRDDLRTVTQLVGDDGLDPEIRNKVGWTPLHAAANGGAERVIAYLIDRRVDVDARCRAGRTPLAEAARNGHLSSVKALVHAGAQALAEDGNGRSVIEMAKGTACRVAQCANLPTKARQAPCGAGREIAQRERAVRRAPQRASGTAREIEH